jgi:hypothetical protein
MLAKSFSLCGQHSGATRPSIPSLFSFFFQAQLHEFLNAGPVKEKRNKEVIQIVTGPQSTAAAAATSGPVITICIMCAHASQRLDATRMRTHNFCIFFFLIGWPSQRKGRRVRDLLASL